MTFFGNGIERIDGYKRRDQCINHERRVVPKTDWPPYGRHPQGSSCVRVPVFLEIVKKMSTEVVACREQHGAALENELLS